VSSSQAVVGAVIGLGLMKGGRGLNYRVLANIASGWVTTPAIACLVCFVSLFFLQNVFNQAVYLDRSYQIEPVVLEKLVGEGLPSNDLKLLMGETYSNVSAFRAEISDLTNLTATEESRLLDASEIVNFEIRGNSIYKLPYDSLTQAQFSALKKLIGNTYKYSWLFDEALASQDDVWKQRPDTGSNNAYNKELMKNYEMVHRLFRNDSE
jgi:PiT family inorganic phosphate transporter